MSMCDQRNYCLHALVTGVSLVAFAFNSLAADDTDSTISGFHVPTPAMAQVLDAAAVADLPRHVFSNGQGLPAGRGSVEQGMHLYAEQCAQCHGSDGQGGRAIELVGDASLLDTQYPDRGIAVYWPHASTLFEYLYRSMPPASPASLNSDELYALIAHLLFLNGLVESGTTLDAQSLIAIEMPNVDGFRTIGR